MTLIKSISGIRGIVGETLSTSVVNSFANIFTHIQPRGDILLARDSRYHGEDFYDNISDTLTLMGRNVVSCGIIPTPTAQYIIKKQKLAGGIVITASHNPIEWNGLKFLDNDGCFLNSKKMQELLTWNPETIKADKGAIINSENAFLDHISNVLNLSCIDINKIKNKKIKVVVDTVNGAAFKALPLLLEKLNCDVVKINCDNTGRFPRGTEPIPSHLTDLSKTVLNEKADIGFATDPDADRLAIIDNNGHPIGEELTLVLAVESYLKFYKDSQTIVTNLSTSMCIDMIAKKYNSSVERSFVGEINVVEKMKELNSKIGGEGNGGVILEESHLGRDSLVASALVLNHLAQSNLPLNKIMDTIPKFVMIKDKINLENDFNLKDIKNSFNENNNISFHEGDGLKIVWKDKWVHIRKSNTEPIIRIISEAKDTKTAESLIKSIKNKINS